MGFSFETVGTNTFLTYEAESSEVDEFSLKMLENNEIQGILPFSCIQEDRIRKIRYAVTSYESLEAYIRRPLPLQRILNILESIAATALALDEYMLYLNGVVLEPAHMYTEIGTGNTWLVYLPVKRTENVEVFGFLRGLLGSVQYETPESAVCMLKISNDMNSGKIAGLGQLLDAVKDAKAMNAAPKPGSMETAARPQISMEKPKPEQTPAAAPIAVASPQPPDMQEEKKKGKDRKPFGFFGGEKKGKEKAGLKKKQESVKAGSFGFAIPGMEPEQYSVPAVPIAADVQDGKKGARGRKKKGRKDPDSLIGIEDPRIENSLPQLPEAPAKAEPAAVKLDFGRTVISQPDDEVTVVEGCGESGEKGLPYLLRRVNGQKMFLEQEITKIGRESAYVDFYIGDNLQIGRSHAEIIQKGQSFFLKDNHSKNHTYINGKMLTGDELVPLTSGDSITLANEVFEYHED